MVKAHSPINWQNKPSVNTPINETNLNKMDSTIGILDDRIIAHDTSKLDKSTANTMVKDVTFNESTGIFTITYLNGSTKTLDTKLEKIATNFKYDYSTQTLILTLIDGTTQSIDMSALLTQYEFTDSDTIGWEVAEDGTVKAKVLDGSITEDMLQPNYLADIRVETAKSQQSMENAKISETNAKESELLAKQYAEDANMYESMVADTVNGNNPTATNSTDGKVIYLKNSGYTKQDGTPTPYVPIEIKGLGDSGTIEVRTQNKNWLKIETTSQTVNGITLTVNEDKSITVSGTATTDSQFPLNDYVLPYGTYKLLGDIILYKLNADDTLYETIVSDSTFVIDERCNRVRPHLWFGKGSTINKTYYPMILLADETDYNYEPYTETVATIPISAPLYEGDYLEVYADGSGKIVRTMGSVVLNGSENWQISIDGQWYYANRYLNNKQSTPCYSEYFVGGNWGLYPLANTICVGNGSIGLVGISVSSFESIDALKEWLQSHNTTVIYEQSTPTSTPLTAEQVQAFKKLYTFDNVTNFFCDGEITARYYVNTDSGNTVSMLQEQAKENLEQIKNDLLSLNKTITDTYTTNTNFSKIVGGTVSSAGLTNIEYTIPTEISSAGLGTQSNNGGTLVDALKTSTSKITEFFGTLYDEISQVEEDNTILDFSNNDVTGSLNVFRHKLSENTYLLNVAATITNITETLSGNGPSVDLTLQDIGFANNIVTANESQCLLASYYPLIVNGNSYCLGGGMASTENDTKGFYLRFLPHKNTKGSINATTNTSFLSGTMVVHTKQLSS